MNGDALFLVFFFFMLWMGFVVFFILYYQMLGTIIHSTQIVEIVKDVILFDAIMIGLDLIVGSLTYIIIMNAYG